MAPAASSSNGRKKVLKIPLPRAPRWLKRIISSSSKSRALKTPQAELASGSREASTPSPVSTSENIEKMNEDVLLEIMLYLDPIDIFALKLTCKYLCSFCSLRSVWYRAAQSLITQSIQFPFRDSEDLSSLSSSELQSAVLHACTLDSNIRFASLRSHSRIATRLPLDSGILPLSYPLFSSSPFSSYRNPNPPFSPDSEDDIGELKGPFKMLGRYFALLTTTRGVYIYDIRQTKYAQDVIKVLSGNVVSEFHVQFLGNGKEERMARLGLGIVKPGGASYLNIYNIYTNEYQGAKDDHQPSKSTRQKQRTAHFEVAASFTLPSPLKQMNISGDFVFGMINEPPFGALWVCDLQNGATGIFELTLPLIPWFVSIVSDHILLSSYDESRRSIISQLIPQTPLIRQLSTPVERKNVTDPYSADTWEHPPLYWADTGPLLVTPSPNFLATSTNDTNPPLKQSHSLPPPSCSFIYPCRGIPVSFVSEWLALSETIPIVSDFVDETGTHIVDRWHLKFIPPNKRASGGAQRGDAGEGNGRESDHTSPTVSPTIVPGSSAYLLPKSQNNYRNAYGPVGIIADSLPTADEAEEPLATLEIIEHSQYTSTQAPGEGTLLCCGTLIWTREGQSGSGPVAVEVLVSPIRAAGIAAREGLGEEPTAIVASGSAAVGPEVGSTPGGSTQVPQAARKNITEGGKLIAKDLRLPQNLALERIIGMDMEDVTGRLMLGLSNGEVWILSFL